MKHHLTGITLAVLVAAGAFLACGDDDGGQETGGTSPIPATTAAGSPESDQQINSSTFEVPFTLTAPAGFEVVNDEPNDFAVERPEGGSEEAAYLAFFVPNGVFNPETAAKEGLPPDLGQWLATNENLEVLVAPEEIEVGGFSGVELDARGADQGAPALLLTLPDDEEGFHLGPLEPARFVVLQIGSATVVIVGGPFNRALFDEVKQDLGTMIASIQFE